MSAFLGPIHYWLYNKIQLQEEFIQAILADAKENNWDSAIQDKLNAACGAGDLQPLEESIDHGNIHGWLQQKIGESEARFAYLVTALLKNNSSLLSNLKETAYRFGKSHSIGKQANASAAFQALTDNLLDGMPCDHVNQILEQEDNQVVWQQAQCLHQDYWQQAGGDISVYYTLRGRMIEGMLAESGLVYIAGENRQFEIRKG